MKPKEESSLRTWIGNESGDNLPGISCKRFCLHVPFVLTAKFSKKISLNVGNQKLTFYSFLFGRKPEETTFGQVSEFVEIKIVKVLKCTVHINLR